MGSTRPAWLSTLQQAITHSAAYRAASSRSLVVYGAVLVSSTEVAAQATSTGYQATRCVRDTTSALPLAASTATVDTIAPGIRYQCLYSKGGPWAIHAISIDLASRRYAVEGARAMDAMFGREKVSDMVQRFRVRGDTPVVAMNADFFSLRTGEVENNAVIADAWVKGVRTSDSPHDGFDNAHTQFAMDDRGRPLIGRFELAGEVRVGSRGMALRGINYRPPRDSGLVLYTQWFGARTPHDSALATPSRAPGRAPSQAEIREDSMKAQSLAAARHAVEVALVRVRGSDSDGWYRVQRGSLTNGGGSAIPRKGAVLSGTGPAADFVRRAARSGAMIHVTARLGAQQVPPRTVVGGWPRLIVDGRNVAAAADSTEGTFPRFSAERHPRSAIGISRDSTTLVFVVVDGRRAWSVGMSLVELADQLLALGAYQAMNLDGGGSSTLWVRGTIVNYPSDPAGERAVGNALIVVPRKSP